MNTYSSGIKLHLHALVRCCKLSILAFLLLELGFKFRLQLPAAYLIFFQLFPGLIMASKYQINKRNYQVCLKPYNLNIVEHYLLVVQYLY